MAIFQSTPVSGRQGAEGLTPLPRPMIPLKGEVFNRSQFLMNIGPPAAEGNPEVMVDINTTPLIDVMLVLLIMLIITIPIQLHSVDINLPQGNPPSPLVEPEVVRIVIEADGSILWNTEPVPGGVAALEPRLARAAAQAVQPEVHVRPDRAVSYDVVAAVMAAIQRNRLAKIGLAGSEQFL